jgi:hypothetical protein
MKKHPKVFDPLFTNMIAAGEAGGILDTILKRLATYIEKAVKLKGQVKSAMIYPIAVIMIAAIVVGVILWKVIPTFANLFAGLGADLPLPTRIVIALSNNLVRFGPFLIIGLVAASFGFRSYYATPNGRRVIDGIVLKMPILGLLMRKIAVARFCRTLSTLLASGVSILEALDITARTAGNAVVEDAIQTTRKSIERGETIAAPLKDTAVFPPMVVQMIGVGEATGALDTMLSKIADFYEEEVDVAGRRPADIAGAGHDRAARRHRRRHRHRDVYADLQSDQQAHGLMDLRSRLSTLIAVRVIVSTLLLGSATLVQINRPGTLLVDPFFFLIGLTYGLSVVYLATLRFVERHPWLIDVQLGADAVIVSAFIYVTGGVTSYFSSLFLLPIIAASTVRFRRGAVQVALLTAVLYMALVRGTVPRRVLAPAARILAAGDAGGAPVAPLRAIHGGDQPVRVHGRRAAGRIARRRAAIGRRAP